MRVAFLANTFHLTQTRSSQFFIDLLRQWFDDVVIVPHQDVWTKMPGRWDLVIVWQHWFRRAELEAFGARSIVLVPMYDDCPLDQEFWSAYLGYKVLCFSQTLADRIEPWGLECLRVKYRPTVPQAQAKFDGLRGFFWPRTSTLDWRHVGPLTAQTDWTSFHLHTGHTPPTAVLPETLPQARQFVRTDWFALPEEYALALAQANVFFAPRRQEGIGMATLEALALGMAVVAPDLPTASEYITPGIDGMLYDPDNPSLIDFSPAPEWGRHARMAAVEGRAAWESQQGPLRAFLESEPCRVQSRARPIIVARGKLTAWLRQGYRAWKRRWKKGSPE